VAERPQDDEGLVRREYETDAGLAGRKAFWERRGARGTLETAFDEVLQFRPARVLEVGCGQGEFAERLAGRGVDVVAVDQSEHMVGLTRARGVDARVADVQDLPFADDEFDVAVANYMLYHVPDLQRGLAELARVAPRLVASTNGVRSMAEMWELVGRDLSPRRRLFFRETGESFLRRHYRTIRAIDHDGTIDMTAADMRAYIAHSIAHKHLAARVPDFEGATTVTLSGAVFVAVR
jgi:SAM-dependent methyltransferase